MYIYKIKWYKHFKSIIFEYFFFQYNYKLILLKKNLRNNEIHIL